MIWLLVFDSILAQDYQITNEPMLTRSLGFLIIPTEDRNTNRNTTNQAPMILCFPSFRIWSTLPIVED